MLQDVRLAATRGAENGQTELSTGRIVVEGDLELVENQIGRRVVAESIGEHVCHALFGRQFRLLASGGIQMRVRIHRVLQ